MSLNEAERSRHHDLERSDRERQELEGTTAPDRASGEGLDRRRFFAAGATVGVASLAFSSCAPSPGASQAGESGADDHPDAGFPWLEATIGQLQQAMAAGSLSAEELTRSYLDRIESIDRSGPSLRSVIETNPDALGIARELDRERRDGAVRGPLHGMPILLKDNIATADRMTTTAGSLALEGSISPADSFVAAQLRRAGAVLLGKANLSEWANIRSTNSSSGWSARGGQCRNPYALDRNPCGSSSGSGAAVSANLCVAAIGTETNGSIVCPSSANGVVGIKPTLGAVSRSRIIPIAHSQDTAGPMARTVEDAAIVLDALVGADPDDTITAAAAEWDPVSALERGGLEGRRIGVLRSSAGFDARVDALMETALDEMRSAGAECVDVEYSQGRDLSRSSYTVLLCELKSDLALYLEALGEDAPVRNLADVIAFNEENAEQEMPYFRQEIFVQAEATEGVEDDAYAEALATSKRLAGAEGIDALVAKHRLDAIVAPTGGPAWVTDLINGDHFSGGSSSLAAVAGYPNVTVPMGFVHGMPVGLSFFGPAWSEALLLRICFDFEQRTRHRSAPTYRARAIEA